MPSLRRAVARCICLMSRWQRAATTGNLPLHFSLPPRASPASPGKNAVSRSCFSKTNCFALPPMTIGEFDLILVGLGLKAEAGEAIRLKDSVKATDSAVWSYAPS